MSNDDDGLVSRFIKHPLTTVATGLGLVGSTFGMVDPVGLASGLAGIVVSTAGTWFPLLGGLRYLGDLVGFIPADVTTKLFIAGAAVYVSYLSLSLVETWAKQLKERFTR